MKNTLNMVGYWVGGFDEGAKKYIHPSIIIDSTWHNEDKAKIIGYLKQGIPFWHDLGYSFCRFEDGPPDDQMGSMDLTDGIWLWPEGLYIYVEKFNIRLPDEFYDHMKENNFNIVNREVDKNADVSDIFWIKWGELQMRKMIEEE